MPKDNDIWLCPHCGEANTAKLDDFPEDEAVTSDCRVCRHSSRLVMQTEADGARGILVTNA